MNGHAQSYASEKGLLKKLILDNKISACSRSDGWSQAAGYMEDCNMHAFHLGGEEYPSRLLHVRRPGNDKEFSSYYPETLGSA